VTGEHGIGIEKISFMPKLFTADDLTAMRRLRDAFNPDNVLSPSKMLPTAGGCGVEQLHPGRRAAL
jgi:glycolate oxidase